MRDRTLIVYWRWAWLGILPGAYLTLLSGNNQFLVLAVVVFFGAGAMAAVMTQTVQLPGATIGALAWLFMMFSMASRYLPLGTMWSTRNPDGSMGQPALLAALYVVGGAAAVLFLGLQFDPIFSAASKPPAQSGAEHTEHADKESGTDESNERPEGSSSVRE